MSNQIVELQAQVDVLQELLEVHERTVVEQSEKIARQTEELQRSNQALEQFAYVISHDLQEPLRMVSAYTQLIGETYRGKLDDKADKYIAFASGGALRMRELINALLDYSRITARRNELTSSSLNAALDDTLRNLELAIKDADVEIRTSSMPLPDVRGDRVQLAQLFQNLIANAIKFRKPDVPAVIEISAVRDGETVVVRVGDNGIGIDRRYHERIFGIFQRLNPKKYDGTGIGLAVCQRIAERHGGKIWVESEPQVGATFYVRLRAAENNP